MKKLILIAVLISIPGAVLVWLANVKEGYLQATAVASAKTGTEENLATAKATISFGPGLAPKVELESSKTALPTKQ
ncbi:MAG: hypothetical protein RI590_05495 [Microbacteriaceae bacterium]|jgi:hypothetical protein|nr:hypothetical protein [Microbacteriaceae bacterium]